MRARILDQRHLGPCMYSRATLPVDTLVAIGNGELYDGQTPVFDTEDSVKDHELHAALRNIKHMLPRLDQNRGPLRFIRARTPAVLGKLLQMPGIENVEGFVLPKVTVENLPLYMAQFGERDEFCIMPTLETRETWDMDEMKRLRILMQEPRIRERVLCVRIGGNDLNGHLGVRRPVHRTIYDTAVGQLIKNLAGLFIPHGFGMTGVVFEGTEPYQMPVLAEELELDQLQGLIGKTIIHPIQIAVVENAYMVDEGSFNDAQEILNAEAAAVFKRRGRMCEPATHRGWAHEIMERAKIYGVKKST